MEDMVQTHLKTTMVEGIRKNLKVQLNQLSPFLISGPGSEGDILTKTLPLKFDILSALVYYESLVSRSYRH